MHLCLIKYLSLSLSNKNTYEVYETKQEGESAKHTSANYPILNTM